MGSPSWHDYRDRWRAVAAIEREEQRAVSLTERWKQLNYLYLLGQGLALPSKESLEETVWQRWAQLKSNL
jgi:hypothetical protein